MPFDSCTTRLRRAVHSLRTFDRLMVDLGTVGTEPLELLEPLEPLELVLCAPDADEVRHAAIEVRGGIHPTMIAFSGACCV